jgi:hypothetical protein
MPKLDLTAGVVVSGCGTAVGRRFSTGMMCMETK